MKIVIESAIEKGLFYSDGALNKEITVYRISYNASSNRVKDDTLIFIQLRL
jgi:hypothetical protein